MDLIGTAIMIGCGAVLLAFLAAVLVQRVIGRYIDGSMSCLQCIIVGGLYLGIAVNIITVDSLVIKILLLLILVALVVLSPILGRRIESGETRRYYDARIEEFRAAIASDPLNLAARSRLADALRKEGRLDEAIEELSEIVRLAPHSIPESHLLKQLLAEQEEKKAPPVTCPSCGHRNPSTRTRCENCESELRAIDEVRKWLSGGGLKQITISLAVTMAVVTVVLFLGSLFSPIGQVLIVALVLLVSLIVQLVLMWLRL